MREINYYEQDVSSRSESIYYGNYVNGSVAPAQAPLPNRETRRKEIEREKELERRQRERSNARALRQSRLNAIGIIFGVVVFGLFFLGYVNLQTSIREHMSAISALKEQISDVKASNSAAQSRISTATDLNEIKETALNDLGMVYANNGQIVYYDILDEDYMSQYQDVR